VVVADSRYPRNGRFIEEIGTYDILKQLEQMQKMIKQMKGGKGSKKRRKNKMLPGLGGMPMGGGGNGMPF
ncbi:MAG: 30S ribosomal protein S16, partial [Ruminococcus sp.]|nr:30S ribosomal protein S16 [Ruminococcus sp.]